jgi:hypothetical protein
MMQQRQMYGHNQYEQQHNICRAVVVVAWIWWNDAVSMDELYFRRSSRSGQSGQRLK